MSSAVSLNNVPDIGFMWTAVKDNSSCVAKVSISIRFILMRGGGKKIKEVQGKVSLKVINVIGNTVNSVLYM